MKTFRSKSNLFFGIIFFSVIVLCEVPMFVGLLDKSDVSFVTLLFLIIPFVAAFSMFVVGMQTINIDENGVSQEVFGIPLKQLTWHNVNEAGTGTVNISKAKYLRQLYVSVKSLSEKELENMDKLRFQRGVIWFDYSLNAQKHLEFYLGMTDSID